MQGHDIIVVGASAGGVEALTQLARGLPRDLPAAVFVVLHVSPQSPSILPSILSRAGALPAAHAVDGMPIEYGHNLRRPCEPPRQDHGRPRPARRRPRGPPAPLG